MRCQTEGIENVRTLLKNDVPRQAAVKLKSVMQEFRKMCDENIKMAKSSEIDKGAGAAKTKLDIFRSKACLVHVEKAKGESFRVTRELNEDTVRNRFKLAKEITRKMKHYAKEASDTLNLSRISAVLNFKEYLLRKGY